jgi:hypothetical protein
VKEEKMEAFIDENLRVRISDASWIIIQGSNYGFLAVGMICIAFSLSLFFICLGTSKWDETWLLVLISAPLPVFTFGLQKWVEIDTINKRVVKKICLFNKLKVRLYQKTYGENIFLIEEVGIDDDVSSPINRTV